MPINVAVTHGSKVRCQGISYVMVSKGHYYKFTAANYC